MTLPTKPAIKIVHIDQKTLCIRVPTPSGHGYSLFALARDITEPTKPIRDAVNSVLKSEVWTKAELVASISTAAGISPTECTLAWLSSYPQRQLIDIVIAVIGFDDSLKDFSSVSGIDYTRLRNLRAENTERRISDLEIKLMYSLVVGDTHASQAYTQRDVLYSIVHQDGHRLTPILPFDEIKNQFHLLGTPGNQIQTYALVTL